MEEQREVSLNVTGLRGRALFGVGAIGLALAATGEWVLRADKVPWLGLLLYLLAIVAFSVGAWPMPSEAAQVQPVPSRRGAIALRVCLTGAIASVLGALVALGRDVKSPTAVRLWLLGSALLVVGGAAAGTAGSWPSCWRITRWPGTRVRRVLAVAVLAAVLLVAALARFVALDRIPLGINADEGDRAAVSIQMLRGFNDESLFGRGWYHISNVYFRTLAGFMEIFGVSVAGARTLGAFAGFVTLVVLLILAIRHFGWRAGVFSATLLSVMGAALMFSRETTEAGPTAMFWTISAACFLEAARRGRALAWIGAGLAGGMSFYFYPTGRLWVVLAVFFGCYLLVRGLLGVSRIQILRGLALAALASFCTISPFLLMARREPGEFTVRARETTIFVKENPRRLSYYREDWNLGQLLAAQLERSVGIFDRFGDNNYFWPTGRPILSPMLAVFALLGLGAMALQWRDPRLAFLTLWFWTGFVGVIVTVETPALQRMTSAIPVVALFAALVLDDLARRLEETSRDPAEQRRRRLAATGVAALLVLVMSMAEARFFFGENARKRYWPYPNAEGDAVARFGADSWAISLGDSFHMLNSGWVRLLAPNAHRAGVLSPGSALPLPLPPVRDLAFFVYPRQPYFLPYLKEVYPGGALTRVTHEPNVQVLDVYRVPLALWRATRGALALPPGGVPVAVQRLGDPPPGPLHAPSRMKWAAWLRVPRYWNYSFRIGPGPARLAIDGVEILTVKRGASSAVATVNLIRGDHEVLYDGLLTSVAEPALFEWAVADLHDPGEAPVLPHWERPLASVLTASLGRPGGLLGVLHPAEGPDQRRLDGAVATGSLMDEDLVRPPFTVLWTGLLRVPVTGRWGFTFYTHGGTVELRADGRTLLRTVGDEEHQSQFDRELAAGTYAIELTYQVARSPGAIEWAWTPPGGSSSIVPPSALLPPPGTTVAAERAIQNMGPVRFQPRQRSMDLVP
ncbi:MAG: glycosyltransferase family 39 protein [Thermoanaerobaculia bacterium]